MPKAENVILDPQGPESSERKTLTNIKAYTEMLPDYRYYYSYGY